MKDGRYKTTCKRAALPGFDEMIQVTFHGLEDEVEFFGGRKEEEVIERNYVGMKGDGT